MSDAFHVDIPRSFLDRMFAVMALCPQHTFQVLTKRPQRAFSYLTKPDTLDRILDAGSRYWPMVKGRETVAPIVRRDESGRPILWPLPNVWLGTSVEDNRVRHRIAALRRAPAAVHFLSCEPLIGPLDLADGYLDHIEWVIAGGESGHGYRPLNLDWARRIRDDCARARVPYLFKQVGGLTPKSGGRLLDGRTWDEFPATTVTP
jgi:protein gp37